MSKYTTLYNVLFLLSLFFSASSLNTNSKSNSECSPLKHGCIIIYERCDFQGKFHYFCNGTMRDIYDHFSTKVAGSIKIGDNTTVYYWDKIDFNGTLNSISKTNSCWNREFASAAINHNPLIKISNNTNTKNNSNILLKKTSVKIVTHNATTANKSNNVPRNVTNPTPKILVHPSPKNATNNTHNNRTNINNSKAAISQPKQTTVKVNIKPNATPVKVNTNSNTIQRSNNNTHKANVSHLNQTKVNVTVRPNIATRKTSNNTQPSKNNSSQNHKPINNTASAQKKSVPLKQTTIKVTIKPNNNSKKSNATHLNLQRTIVNVTHNQSKNANHITLTKKPGMVIPQNRSNVVIKRNTPIVQTSKPVNNSKANQVHLNKTTVRVFIKANNTNNSKTNPPKNTSSVTVKRVVSPVSSSSSGQNLMQWNSDWFLPSYGQGQVIFKSRPVVRLYLSAKGTNNGDLYQIVIGANSNTRTVVYKQTSGRLSNQELCASNSKLLNTTTIFKVLIDQSKKSFFVLQKNNVILSCMDKDFITNIRFFGFDHRDNVEALRTKSFDTSSRHQKKQTTNNVVVKNPIYTIAKSFNFIWNSNWQISQKENYKINVSARASSNIIIGLSRRNRTADPMYYIVIGGNNNTDTYLSIYGQRRPLCKSNKPISHPTMINYYVIDVNEKAGYIKVLQNDKELLSCKPRKFISGLKFYSLNIPRNEMVNIQNHATSVKASTSTNISRSTVQTVKTVVSQPSSTNSVHSSASVPKATLTNQANSKSASTKPVIQVSGTVQAPKVVNKPIVANNTHYSTQRTNNTVHNSTQKPLNAAKRYLPSNHSSNATSKSSPSANRTVITAANHSASKVVLKTTTVKINTTHQTQNRTNHSLPSKNNSSQNQRLNNTQTNKNTHQNNSHAPQVSKSSNIKATQQNIKSAVASVSSVKVPTVSVTASTRNVNVRGTVAAPTVKSGSTGRATTVSASVKVPTVTVAASTKNVTVKGTVAAPTAKSGTTGRATVSVNSNLKKK